MVGLAIEREHLAHADRDIGAGERRIAAQRLLLARLRRDGRETGEAERLLLNFEQTLAMWKVHRDAILQEIARLEEAGRS